MPASGSASRRQWSARRNRLGRWRYYMRGFFWRSWMIQKSATWCIWCSRNDWTLLKCWVSKSFELPLHLKVCLWSLSLSLYVEVYAACDWTFSRLWAHCCVVIGQPVVNLEEPLATPTKGYVLQASPSAERFWKCWISLDLHVDSSGMISQDWLMISLNARQSWLSIHWCDLFSRSTHGIRKVLFHCLVSLKKQPILF